MSKHNPNTNRLKKKMSTQKVAKIPVVDLSKLEDTLKPGTSCWLSARKQICDALEELGCFIAVLPNKASLEVQKNRNTMFGAWNELFDFPIEIKKKNAWKEPFLGGYKGSNNSVYQGMGIKNGTSPEETQKFTHLFWPNGNTQFSESVNVYAKVMVDLDHVVTKMVFENYGVEKYHDDHIESLLYTLRFNKYKGLEKIGTDMGLPVHTDKTFSTILHQNHVNGLEINIKDDEWIGYDPLPLSFIFIAGDAFQVWSNDRIRSCTHKVTLRETEDRYTIGLFSIKQGVTHIPNELVDKDHPLRYKPLNQLEYLNANAGPTKIPFKAYCGI